MVKVGPKVQILGQILQKNFQTLFLLARLLLLVKTSAKLDYIWGIKAPKIYHDYISS